MGPTSEAVVASAAHWAGGKLRFALKGEVSLSLMNPRRKYIHQLRTLSINLHVALDGFLLQRFSFVVFLFAFADSKFDLGPAIFEVHSHRHNRHSLLNDSPIELFQLMRM